MIETLDVQLAAGPGPLELLVVLVVILFFMAPGRLKRIWRQLRNSAGILADELRGGPEPGAAPDRQQPGDSAPASDDIVDVEFVEVSKDERD